jgi:hypothetical protein
MAGSIKHKVKDVYTENYKALKKDSEDTRGWKDPTPWHVHGSAELIL